MADGMAQSTGGYSGPMPQGRSTIAAQPPTYNPSCFSSIESVALDAAKTASRVEELVSRLAGPLPESDPKPDLRAASFGLLGVAGAHANEISTAMVRANLALDRLEKLLP